MLSDAEPGEAAGAQREGEVAGALTRKDGESWPAQGSISAGTHARSIGAYAGSVCAVGGVDPPQPSSSVSPGPFYFSESDVG